LTEQAAEKPIRIASILFERLDQIDLTGPFEVFSRLTNCSYDIVAKEIRPMKDANGLTITPNQSFAECQDVDVLHIPGGPGQEDLMEDEETLSFIRDKASRATFVFSVCTGALVCGAAGLLRGRKATTHWGFKTLLPHFGAISVDSRVVIDGNLISCAGVTAGIDGALMVACLVRGQAAAEQIQLLMEYAPDPPFNCGAPDVARADLVQSAREALEPLLSRRLATARRCAEKLGIVS